MKKITYTLFLVMLAFASVVLACQRPAEPLAIYPANAATPQATAEPSDDAPRISLADAKTAFDAGTAIFVDTRPESAYNAEHIKGAINISQDKLETKISSLPKNKKIIAYCS